MEALKDEPQVLAIPAIEKSIVEIQIIGITPYLMNPRNQNVVQQVLNHQKGNAPAKVPYDEDASMQLKLEHLKNGGYGICCGAFFKAMVAAAKRNVKSVKGTVVMQSIQFHGDDLNDRSLECVELRGKPQKHMSLATQNRGGGATVVTRPMFMPWSATLHMSVAGTFSIDQAINLVAVAGEYVGVGDWRPEKMGTFGKFRIESAQAIIS